jgi:hypothetical protein
MGGIVFLLILILRTSRFTVYYALTGEIVTGPREKERNLHQSVNSKPFIALQSTKWRIQAFCSIDDGISLDYCVTMSK